MATNIAEKNQLKASKAPALNNGQSPIWHKSAPKSIVAAYEAGHEDDAWTTWCEHLAKRKRPVDPQKLVPGRLNSLLWAMPNGVDVECIGTLVELLDVEPNGGGRHEADLVGRVESWISTEDAPAATAQFGYEALAWAYRLPQLARSLPAALWWQLVEYLVVCSRDAAALDVVQEPLTQQLLAGELPLVLAYQLPELRDCHSLLKPARKALSAGLIETLDGQGLPHCSNLMELRPLLACWTRAGVIGKHVKNEAWNKEADVQYGWLVRQALHLTRPDGGQVLEGEEEIVTSHHLFRTALELAGDRDDRMIAAENLPRSWCKDLDRSKNIKRLPEASYNSTWSDMSVLRCDWTRKSPSFVATYADETFAAELSNQARVLSSGVWETELRHAGKQLEPDSEWEEVCWVSDEDVDYLELQMKWTGGVTLQRQLLLARDDQFLFTADAVLGQTPGKWEYRQSLPLAEGVVFAGEEETREGFVTLRGRRQAMVIPPALPEWRVDRRGGSLGLNASGLELRLSADGAAMYAPLFVDLKPDRFKQEKTWRQLTVAEHLKVQPADVAVGYRVQLGRKQWLFYRSLARCSNRTLLSHNLVSEFLAARFTRQGEVETLLEIEQ